MFWKSKKKEKEDDWNTAHKNLKPLKNNEEIQHHQKEDNQKANYDREVIDEYESYLSNHSLSKKFIVCLDFESLRSKFERGFESGLKKDLITQEDRNEYSSISKTVERNADSVVDFLFPKTLFSKEENRFYQFYTQSEYAGALCTDYGLGQDELKKKVRERVKECAFDYDKHNVRIFSFNKDEEIDQWLRDNFSFSNYGSEYIYVWKKQKEWKELYREYMEPSEGDRDNFGKVGLRLHCLDYRDPEEEILCVDWRHNMGMFGYHKSYWFSENHPYPEEMEVRLLAIANYFPLYHTFFHLDYDGLVKIANGDLNEYRSLIFPVLDDLDEKYAHNPLYQADRVIQKVREFLFGTRSFKETFQ